MNNLILNPGITIFGFTIYWYGIFIVSGMVVALVMLSFLFKRFKISTDAVYNYALIIIPVAVVCARLLYVISEGGNFFDIRNGGLSIYGGLIGGAAMLFVGAKLQKHEALKIGDLAVPCVAVAQAIGRWGNFVNDEVYGRVVTNPSWQWFPIAYESADAGGNFVMALFFYEMVWNLLGATLVLYLILKHYRKGMPFGTYLIWYGCGRFFLEGLRNPKFVMGTGGFRTSAFVSVICILGGLALYAYAFRHELLRLYCRIMKKPLPETAAPAEKLLTETLSGDEIQVAETAAQTQSGQVQKKKSVKKNTAGKLKEAEKPKEE